MTEGNQGQSDLLDRLPAELVDSLSAEQRAGLWQALQSPTWRRHPVNIRLSLPLPGRRFYLTIVGGTDRRNAERVKRERRLHPLRTAGNLLFLFGIVVAFYLSTLVVILVGSRVLEF